MVLQQQIDFETHGRGTADITGKVQGIVDASGLGMGLCNLFIHHTSASLLLTENADPQVRRDLEMFLSTHVPDGDPMFAHDAEGPDDMPAHVRVVLTESSLTIPVTGSRLALGTWQGIYLYEHRRGNHQRKITVTLFG